MHPPLLAYLRAQPQSLCCRYCRNFEYLQDGIDGQGGGGSLQALFQRLLLLLGVGLSLQE